MMSFWDKSVRDFDQSIKNIFMDELLKRKVAKEKLNDNDNDNDNEDSSTNRARIVQAEDEFDVHGFVACCINYLNQKNRQTLCS